MVNASFSHFKFYCYDRFGEKIDENKYSISARYIYLPLNMRSNLVHKSIVIKTLYKNLYYANGICYTL